MKPRLVFVSVLGGFLASQVLSFVFKGVWPGYIAPQFITTNTNPDLAWAGYALAGLLILVSGYAAARLEWSLYWGEAILQGVGAGLLAGCLAYLLSAAPAASGMMGQKEILLSIPRTVSGEQEGVKLLIQGVVNTAVWVQAVFWTFLLASIFLGGLGGLLSRIEGRGGWGKMPAPKAPHLARLTVYTIGFFGIVNLAITVAVLTILPDLTFKAITKSSATSDGLLLPPWAVLTLPLITGIAFVAVCAILSTWWTLKGWKHPEERFRVKVSLIIFGLLMLVFFFVANQLALLTIAILAVIGLTIWVIQRVQPSAPGHGTETIRPYNGLDLLASALTQGILSATLVTASMITYSLSLILIAVVDIAHLMNTGPLQSTAQEQIASLYTTTTVASIMLLVVTSAIGLLLAGIGVWTGMLRAAPRPQPAETPFPNDG